MLRESLLHHRTLLSESVSRLATVVIALRARQPEPLPGGYPASRRSASQQ
jgi:hypothetical protein